MLQRDIQENCFIEFMAEHNMFVGNFNWTQENYRKETDPIPGEDPELKYEKYLRLSGLHPKTILPTRLQNTFSSGLCNSCSLKMLDLNPNA